MKRLFPLIKPASSLCNMRCSYCFYADVSSRREFTSRGIMSRDTAQRIIGNIFLNMADGDEVTFGFQGGEPTLAGLPWFQDFVTMATALGRKLTVRYSLQTNGLLLDEQWCEFLKKNDFLVGLSIDGGEGSHDRNRFDSQGRNTYREVLLRKQLLEKYSVEYNILCVLTNDLAGDPDRVWRFVMREKIRYIQFIPCLDDLAETGVSRYALRPARFASFFSRLFYWWKRELEAGRYVSVKLFDDVAQLFFRNTPTACGITGQCYAQYVIEADGEVYPCDFYALDEYSTGNLTEQTPQEIYNSERMQHFLGDNPPLPELCVKCVYHKACGGGCKRMRKVMCCGRDGVMCGYQAFLDKCLGPLERAVHDFFDGKHEYHP